MLRLNSEKNIRKQIEELADNFSLEKGTMEFEYNEYPEITKDVENEGYKKGEISNDGNGIKILMPEISDYILNELVETFGEKNYNFVLENEDITFSYNSNRKTLGQITNYEKNDIEDLRFRGLVNFNEKFPDCKYSYINTDKDGNTMKLAQKNKIIEEIDFKGLNYNRNLDKNTLEEQLKTLKFFEISNLKEGLNDLDYFNYIREENKTLYELVETREEHLAAEIFLYDYKGDETVYLIKIPENYTMEDLSKSITSYFGSDDDLILNLTSEQSYLIPELQKTASVTDGLSKIDITLNQPKDVILNLGKDRVHIYLQKELNNNTFKEGLNILNSYKNLFEKKEGINFVVFDADNNVLMSDKDDLKNENSSIQFHSKESVNEDLLLTAKNLSDYENKKVMIYDVLSDNFFEIKDKNVEFSLGSEEYRSANIPEKIKMINKFSKENNLEKLFENVKCDGVTPNKENNEKTFKNTFSISR